MNSDNFFASENTFSSLLIDTTFAINLKFTLTFSREVFYNKGETSWVSKWKLLDR